MAVTQVPQLLSSFAGPERLTALAQTKLTSTENALLDEFVQWCHDNGITEATRSSVMRTFVVTGLRSIRSERGLE